MKVIKCVPDRCRKSTHKKLDNFLEQQRQLWNAALGQRNEAYKKILLYLGPGISKKDAPEKYQKFYISKFDQMKELTQLRKVDSEYNQYSVDAQRSILHVLEKSFQNFFRRVKQGEKPGYPRFKGKYNPVISFDIDSPRIKYVCEKTYSMNVKGIGWFKFKHDDLDLKQVRQARITKTPRRLIIQFTVNEEINEFDDNREPIGIDVGIKTQITLSNGIQYDKRRRDLREMKKRQQSLSKAVKGSNSRQKKKSLLAKSHQRLQESERGYLHRETRSLIKNHSSKFFLEDLKIKNMVKNKKWSRSIHEQMWGAFNELLTYKAEDAGGWVKKVNPRNTTQRCSFCGHIPEVKIGLDVRIFSCENCGYTLDRDINASINILQIGISNQPGVKLLESPGVFGEYDISDSLWSTEHL